MEWTRTVSLTALAVAVLFSAQVATPAAAKTTRSAHSKHSMKYRHKVMRHSVMAARRHGSSPGIGTHGTATTGAGEGTSTNMVPAGGTSADPLGGGTTSTGTATTGTGTSSK